MDLPRGLPAWVPISMGDVSYSLGIEKWDRRSDRDRRSEKTVSVSPSNKMPFQYTLTEEGEIAVIEARGPVSSRYSPQLRKVIAQAFDSQCKHVIVNIDAVNYMDSSGLATLVEGMQLAEIHQGKFLLAGSIEEKIVHLFEITHLEALFENHPTVEDAKRSLRQI